MYRHTVGKAIGDKAAFDKFIHGLFFNNLIVVDDKCTSEFFRTVHHFHETVRRHTVVDPENAVTIQKASGADCQILGIEDGTHGLLYAKHSDEIEQSIDHFIGEYINNQQQLVVE